MPAENARVLVRVMATGKQSRAAIGPGETDPSPCGDKRRQAAVAPIVIEGGEAVIGPMLLGFFAQDSPKSEPCLEPDGVAAPQEMGFIDREDMDPGIQAEHRGDALTRHPVDRTS